MDLLSEVLQTVDVEASSFVNLHPRAPWGFEIRDADHFHFAYCYCLIEGEAIVLEDGAPATTLAPGDILLLPGGGASRISSSPQAPAVRIGDLWRGRHLPDLNDGATIGASTHVRFDGDGAETHLLALAFRLRGRRYQRLLSALPQQLLYRAGQRTLPFLRSALDFLAEDGDGQQPGYMAVANGLAGLVFMFVLRESILHDARHDARQAGGWLRGLFDKQIGKALLAIHRRPQVRWTVDNLAVESGMSRSAFAQRFNACTGQSPIDYLTAWRVACAEEALAQSEQPIGAIANALGYQSESAFRKVFAKRTGMTPSGYRAVQRQQ
jgi:AraC-like DNA-binding protein